MAGHNNEDMDFINLNDISDAPPVIEPGEYHVKIVECTTKAKKDGTGKYVSYRVVVQAGPEAGTSFYCMWSLGERSAWRMKKDFKAIGYNPPGGVPHNADLLGFEGIAEVKVEPEKDGYPAKNSVAKWIGPLV